MRRAIRAVPFVFVFVVWTLTTHGKFSDSGDEPHYLMVAESLLSDHDLDLANNYANGDGRWFGADTLEAGPHARVTQRGQTWSSHDVGLPILILPVYAIATRVALAVPDSTLAAIRQPRGLFAYSLISISLTIFTACGLALLGSALSRYTTPTTAAVTVLVLGLSPPVLSHAFLVFPETLAFFVVCAFVWLCSLPSSEVTASRAVLVTTAVGSLPWLHRKFSFLVFGLLLVAAIRHRAWLSRQRTSLVLVVAALGIGPQLVLHLWTFLAWGHVGGPQLLNSLPFSIEGIQRGALGLVLDRERGLLAYAPIYLLVPAAWALTWRSDRVLLIPIALLYLPMAAFSVWGAGFSPAARYLVPLTPLVALPIAKSLANPAMRKAAVPLLIFQSLILASVWTYPRALWPKELGTNEALERIPLIGRAYERVLPSLLTGDSVVRGWLVVAVIAAMTAILVRASARQPVQSGLSH